MLTVVRLVGRFRSYSDEAESGVLPPRDRERLHRAIG